MTVGIPPGDENRLTATVFPTGIFSARVWARVSQASVKSFGVVLNSAHAGIGKNSRRQQEKAESFKGNLMRRLDERR